MELHVNNRGDTMRKVLGLLLLLVAVSGTWAQERQDTIVVSRDGTGNFRTLQEAIESARAFMDYTVTIYVRNGVYKEKVIVPSWVENIDIIGEDRDKTIITYDDHANINKMGTFRTYTVKVEGSDITFKNLTIENNAAQLGQAVALHTEGDRLKFINCRILGNQDTIYLVLNLPVFILKIVILMVLLTLFSVLPPLYLKIVLFTVNAIRM